MERLLTLAREKRVETIDLKFVSLPGRWHHLSLPAERLDEQLLHYGVGFDGSSVPGYSQIASSDMTLIPDPDTAILDPFWDRPTLSLICDIYRGDGTPYRRDPRGVARRAEAFMLSTGIADAAMMSPEFEFYIFDSVRHRNDINMAFYRSTRRRPTGTPTARKGGGSRMPPRKGGYHAMPPQDSLYNLRDEMARQIKEAGIPVKLPPPRGGRPGPVRDRDQLFHPLLRAGDVTMLVKYLTDGGARGGQDRGTYMPKPL